MDFGHNIKEETKLAIENTFQGTNFVAYHCYPLHHIATEIWMDLQFKICLYKR